LIRSDLFGTSPISGPGQPAADEFANVQL
jgi:hypothetical protein